MLCAIQPPQTHRQFPSTPVAVVCACTRWRPALAALIVAAALGRALGAPPPEVPVQQRLEQTLVTLDFEDISLGKILQQFRTEHQLNIYVNERALSAKGIGLATPVTLHVNQVPLATALRLILRSVSENGTLLTYVVEDGVLVISTAADTTATPVLRVYDVIDLIDSGFAKRRIMNTPLLRLHLTGHEGEGAESGPGGGSASQNPFQGGSGGGLDSDSANKTFERLNELIELIKETVASGSWRDNGGAGSIRRQGQRLIVTATPVVHHEIEGLLKLLRNAVPPTVDLHVSLVQMPLAEAEELRAKLADDWPRLPAAEALALEGRMAGQPGMLLRSTTTGPSGQAQMVSSLRQQGYVEELQPVVDETAETYQPCIDHVDAGIELIVLPVLSADGASMTLDVSMALASFDPLESHVFLKDGTGQELNVQLRSARMRTLVSNIRLARGQAILLTVPPADLPDRPEADGAERSDPVFLLIRPSVK